MHFANFADILRNSKFSIYEEDCVIKFNLYLWYYK